MSREYIRKPSSWNPPSWGKNSSKPKKTYKYSPPKPQKQSSQSSPEQEYNSGVINSGSLIENTIRTLDKEIERNSQSDNLHTSSEEDQQTQKQTGRTELYAPAPPRFQDNTKQTGRTELYAPAPPHLQDDITPSLSMFVVRDGIVQIQRNPYYQDPNEARTVSESATEISETVANFELERLKEFSNKELV
ncbi:MAG: hypothetical protein F6K24_49955, partial [Okeania sp. SIO2D1]|nr:hypothetical protein [Okeania sp. SIO2D1]